MTYDLAPIAKEDDSYDIPVSVGLNKPFAMNMSGDIKHPATMQSNLFTGRLRRRAGKVFGVGKTAVFRKIRGKCL